ncbi:DUF922 domain-containing protein [Pseudomonas sp. GXZC]|uniref:DUF922 domain-containing protein n=1 Tax=Pseudomonas sp. GXZC TaxID=3003351 RepID=UPI0022AB379C|nr:DUF922 domain-containing protein [Pseudomonas sp. GXZC]WAT32289.1 DUF922 domain-containing protein [Pseudomonas sp. GXZC]WAT32293.1 DUF922 domain-containing protein [Pseudomonas sp. GXZC]
MQVGDRGELTIKQSFKTYPVSGSSWQEVMRSLSTSPLDVKGETAYGITNSTWDWRYDVVSDESSCWPSHFSLTVEVVVIVPELVGASLREGEMNLWRQYANGVATHERIHAQDALDLSMRVVNKVVALPPLRSCSEVESEIRTIYQDERVWYEQRAAFVDSQALGFPRDFRFIRTD